jgi:hypothetical protein
MIRRLKNSLRWWRADLPVATALLSITFAFGLFGWIIFGVGGGVGGVLVSLALIQLMDIIP